MENKKVCTVSYHGKYRRKQVEIGKDVLTLFHPKKKDIILEFNGRRYYSKLFPSFFTNCKHLRTAYDNKTYKGTNRLHEWLDVNNVKKISLEVIERYVEFRLTILYSW